MRIAYSVTIPVTAHFFLTGQLAHLAKSGHEVRLFSREEPTLQQVAEREGVSAQGLPLERDIAPLADLRALWVFWRRLREFRPDLTVIGTPKAGLIGGLAALLARVPVRIYVNHGIRGEFTPGFKGKVIRAGEWVLHACATKVICVSPSTRERVIEMGTAPADKVVVIGSGSANGIDAARFSEPPPAATLADLRARLGLGKEAKVLGFVGRLVRDKGVEELVAAFDMLRPTRPDLRLLLIGNFEALDPISPATRSRIEQQQDGIVWAGPVPDAAPYYHLMTLLALPTYREGLGMVSLEAAAAGVPVVTTAITGARDAIADGVTGLLVKPADAEGLAGAVAELLDDPVRAQEMGRAGRERVLTEFNPERIWRSLDQFFSDLVEQRRGRRLR